jgi:hypothetical protein
MPSKIIGERGAAKRWERWSPVVVGAVVVVGLAASGMANLWIDRPGEGALPGVALGSETVLVVERVLALFAAWLLVLVVVAQAFRGRLPTEVSGRGVRYADGSETQDSLASTQEALSELDGEMKAFRRHVEDLTTRDSDHRAC